MQLPSFHSVPLPPHNSSKGAKNALELLRSIFGHKDFRGVQAEAVAATEAGRDVLALMPTGGGKSLCYQIPAMSLPGTALVISPLIALMRDQADGMRRIGIRAAALVSGASMPEDERRMLEDELANGRLDIVLASPERLASERFMSILARTSLSLVAIDEAHCVCEWGHDFRPDYLEIAPRLDTLPRAPRIALTASATLSARQEIRERLLSPEALILSTGFDRPNIALDVRPGPRDLDAVVATVTQREGLGAALIYCTTRAATEETAAHLRDRGIRAVTYHGGMDAESRSQAQDAFVDGKVGVAVATSAFGMGVDKSDVATVIHLGLPSSIEAYYQEIGRAGRDGRPSRALLMWSPSDVGRRTRLAAGSDDEAQRRREIGRLESVIGYVETPGCRRTALLARFGETFFSGCGRCDRCLTPPVTADAREKAAAALGLAARLGAGIGITSEILAGLRTPRVLAGNYDRMPGFGSATEDGIAGARRLLRQMIGLGLLDIDDSTGGVRPTQAGRDAVASGAAVMLSPLTALRRPSSADGQGLPQWRREIWHELVDERALVARSRNMAPRTLLGDRDLAAVVSRLAAGSRETGNAPDWLRGRLATALARHAPAASPPPVVFDLF